MELAEALKRRLPLQLRMPHRQRPLETAVMYAAEVFLVETTHGPAVSWLDPFWCDKSPQEACHIAYARPNGAAGPGRWVDNEPSYGPRCIAWQKPFVLEELNRGSPAWADYKAWQIWCSGKSDACGRKAAWRLVEETFGDLIVNRVV